MEKKIHWPNPLFCNEMANISNEMATFALEFFYAKILTYDIFDEMQKRVDIHFGIPFS